MNNILFVFPVSYPYPSADEKTFLQDEIKAVCDVFPEVIIIPRQTGGEPEKLPTNAKLETGLAKYIVEKSRDLGSYLLPFLKIPEIVNEISKHPCILLHPRLIIDTLSFLRESYITKTWLLSYLRGNNISPDYAVFYTYYLNRQTFGIQLLKKHLTNLKLIARAHGKDLYLERHFCSYIPFRDELLRGIDHIFTVSENGRRYLIRQNNDLCGKIATSRLGVRNMGSKSKISLDKKIRIVSCSAIISVKRLDLLACGMISCARKNPKLNLIWIHIGSGKGIKKLNKILKDIPCNLSVELLGRLENEEVLSYYRNNPCDLFINVSSSEGLPVSVMEAQSFGIPVMATNVGGTSEIVDNENGFLLPADICSLDLGNAISDAIKELNSLSGKKREKSLQAHESLCCAKSNFSDFARELTRFNT